MLQSLEAAVLKSNKMEHFSYKGVQDVREHMRIEVFKRTAGWVPD